MIDYGSGQVKEELTVKYLCTQVFFDFLRVFDAALIREV
jgi:hypothetical protein